MDVFMILRLCCVHDMQYHDSDIHFNIMESLASPNPTPLS